MESPCQARKVPRRPSMRRVPRSGLEAQVQLSGGHLRWWRGLTLLPVATSVAKHMPKVKVRFFDAISRGNPIAPARTEEQQGPGFDHSGPQVPEDFDALAASAQQQYQA
ncbi:hypothetical protein D3C81_1313660 [compost metagenome]